MNEIDIDRAAFTYLKFAANTFYNMGVAEKTRCAYSLTLANAV